MCRNIINDIFQKIRLRIAVMSLVSAPETSKFKVDEPYFGTKRIEDKRSRGATERIPIFEMLKRDGKVFENIVKKTC